MTPDSRTDDELRRVIGAKTPPPSHDDSAWHLERERAQAELWQRRLASGIEVSAAEVVELVSYAELETSLSALGDAARLGLISRSDCEAILGRDDIDRFSKSDWAKGEVALRLKVHIFLAERDLQGRRRILDDLLHQKRFWPIDELIPGLGSQELDHIETCLEDRSVLSRHGREQARQAIRARRTQIPTGSRRLH